MNTSKQTGTIIQAFIHDSFSESNGVRIDPWVLKIEKKNIKKLIDHPADDNDPYIESLIDSYIQQCREICSPAAAYRIFDHIVHSPEDNTFSIKGVNFFVNKIVNEQLKNSIHMIVFAATAGNEIENYANQLNAKDDFLESYIVNAIGSVIAETAAGYLHQRIEKIAGDVGIKATNPYSPGYCDWNVSEQRKLFSLLPENVCNIRLTESALMMPIKSVTGFIGIGHQVKKTDYPCKFCPHNSCIGRKTGNL